MDPVPQHDDLIAEVEAHGGWVNRDAFGLSQFPGMGFGAVAKADLPAQTSLFRIPLTHLLTPFTSHLRRHLSETEWESLGDGWARLILVMMWETERGSESQWYRYLAAMPRTFDTPMFWAAEELEELRGTDIQDRVGKTEAETTYHSLLAPIIMAHPDLFPPGAGNFSLASYHLQGSRILSRSFTIPASRAGQSQDASSVSSKDDEEEDEVAVMVPMADMLNAAYEMDNARLYANDGDEENEITDHGADPDSYTMTTSRSISKGDQIYNTYASPPNSELLRKYGHVDAIPLDDATLALLEAEEVGEWPFGNPGDQVEIQGDEVVRAVLSHRGSSAAADSAGEELMTERIDWWLEEGQDDAFALSFSEEVDEGLVPFTRLLLYDDEWLRAARKGKLPRNIVDQTVAEVLHAAIVSRQSKYCNDLQHDLDIIKAGSASQRRRNAAVVRAGEKRVLKVAMRAVRRKAVADGVPGGKRKSENLDSAGEKIQRTK
ncbi:hypothetical protein EHS25_002033 [Saitozyma podzolica]|uniref:SET domain-containing protein n=1 Tax=Saitozyma podzolica TaxID=1890683 RepID=A0A427YEV1_9TREE|nr:hypothetical protein EHS25_002033 [Saitozyma podzolica]